MSSDRLAKALAHQYCRRMAIRFHHSDHTGSVDDEAALVQFQKGWSTYQKVIDHNALAHREVEEALHRALSTIHDPIDFLDIACGDAGQMRRALVDSEVRHYRGIDLSRPALKLAARNLEGVSFDCDLHHADFVVELKARHYASDVSWCGLSIHHLTVDRKRAVFQALSDTTSRCLMVYEPILHEGESLESCFDRYAQLNKPAWTFLTADEWDEVFHHISTYDVPETPRTWMELGLEAGFSEAREIYVDPLGFYGLYRYDR